MYPKYFIFLTCYITPLPVNIPKLNFMFKNFFYALIYTHFKATYSFDMLTPFGDTRFQTGTTQLIKQWLPLDFQC